MIDRNKIVRIFRNKHNEHNMPVCITCDGIIHRRDQKRCPIFLGERYFCICKYSDNGLIIHDPNAGKLFNNTTYKIISTIYDCGSDINRCHVLNCDNCNLMIVIKYFKEGQ